MSHPIHLANKNSAYRKFLGDHAPSTSPWDYALDTNVPPYVNMKTVTLSKNSFADGALLYYDIPRYGLLEKAYFIAQIETAAGNTTVDKTISDNLVASWIDYVELRSRERTVSRLYGQNIMDMLLHQNREKRYNELVIGGFQPRLVQCNAATIGPFITELPFSFFERLSHNIDTDFAEPLQLVVKLNLFNGHVVPDQGAVAATYVNGGNTKLDLKLEFKIPDAEEQARQRKMLVAAPDSGITKLQWSVFKEASVTMAGTTSMDIKCPFPAWRTLIVVRKTGISSGAIGIKRRMAVGEYKNQQVTSGTASPSAHTHTVDRSIYTQDTQKAEVFGKLTEIKFKGSEDFFHWASEAEIRRHQTKYTNSPWGDPFFNELRVDEPLVNKLATTSDTTLYYIINWGMTETGLDQSGFMSFDNIANPQLEFVGTTGDLVDVYHYYNFLNQVAPRDGFVLSRTLN